MLELENLFQKYYIGDELRYHEALKGILRFYFQTVSSKEQLRHLILTVCDVFETWENVSLEFKDDLENVLNEMTLQDLASCENPEKVIGYLYQCFSDRIHGVMVHLNRILNDEADSVVKEVVLVSFGTLETLGFEGKGVMLLEEILSIYFKDLSYTISAMELFREQLEETN